MNNKLLYYFIIKFTFLVFFGTAVSWYAGDLIFFRFYSTPVVGAYMPIPYSVGTGIFSSIIMSRVFEIIESTISFKKLTPIHTNKLKLSLFSLYELIVSTVIFLFSIGFSYFLFSYLIGLEMMQDPALVIVMICGNATNLLLRVIFINSIRKYFR